MNTPSPYHGWVSYLYNTIDGSCEALKKDKKAICLKKLENIPKNTFSIHGLWPGLKTGAYLDDCSGPLTRDDIVDASEKEENKEFFTEKMYKSWVSYNDDDPTFWLHEYNKHGYCYSLRKNQTDFVDYFKDAFEFFEEYDFANLFKKAFPDAENTVVNVTQAEVDKIIQTYLPGSYYRLECSKSTRYITQIYFYYDEEFKPYKVPFKVGRNCGSKNTKLKILFK